MENNHDSKTYATLLGIASQASRLEDRMNNLVTPAIKAAAESDPDKFEETLAIVEHNLGGHIPLVLQTLKVVVHDAREAGLSLTDQFGMPKRIGALRAELDEYVDTEEEAPTPTPKRKRAARKKKRT